MCSFGESISMTPLQLGALVSAIANGGTLYYLQHPTTPAAVATSPAQDQAHSSTSAPSSPRCVPGMEGAVDAPYGTARRLQANFTEFPVIGKTGTCSNNGTRFGWFGSYADTPNGRIVTVIFLEGGRPTFGPKAAELTGVFYRALYDKKLLRPQGPIRLRRRRSHGHKVASPPSATADKQPDKPASGSQSAQSASSLDYPSG